VQQPRDRVSDVFAASLAGTPSTMSASATGGNQPGVASGASTLVEVLAEYEEAGFAAEFSTTDDGRLSIGDEAAPVDASAVEVVSFRRLEGASDPGDMAVVFALRAPDGSPGVAVLRYGPEASPEEADVLRALEGRLEGRDD